jgi:DNA mismatch repair protein MutL
MSKIIILDEKTANQIAAGEVIERPASVVKEMVENAIDAGATAITVEIRNGGVSYIRVTDNGSGMEGDDVEIAFERHATSKIRRIEDLDGLATMGFRGEALASIAAVSHLEVKTKTADAQHGTLLRIEGGRVVEVGQTGCPDGTTFVVKNLFFNTPARYKFLKKDSTEAGYVTDTMERLALSHPEISFKLVVNGQVQHHTPGNNDLISVIYSIYGKDTAKSLIPVQYYENGMAISGFIGRPEIARGTRNQQSIFINGRFIRSRVISSALEDAYKTILMQHKFPFCVLNLKASPETFDVNVHPQKLEVRFSNDSAIYSHIFHAVKNALTSTSLLREYEDPGAASELPRGSGGQAAPWENGRQSGGPGSGYGHSVMNAASSGFNSQKQQGLGVSSQLFPGMRAASDVGSRPGEQGARDENSRTWGQEVKENGNKSVDQVERIGVDGSGAQLSREDGNRPEQEEWVEGDGFKTGDGIKAGADHTGAEMPVSTGNAGMTPHARLKEALELPFNVTRNQRPIHGEPLSEPVAETSVQISIGDMTADASESEALKVAAGAERLLQAEIVGQAFDTYIILQQGEDMLLIDQHAAHERIRYETLKDRLKRGEPVSQLLLEPVIINLSSLEMDFVRKKLTDFERIGFELEEFGPATIMLRGVPDISEGFSQADFHEVLDRWMQSPGETSGISDETLFLISCKGALKANKRLYKEEIIGLIQKLAAMENPYTCVHGRPVIISLSKKELEKRFKRIV